MTHAARRAKLSRYLPAVALVTDATRLRGRDPVAVIAQAVDGGATIVQLREKTLAHDELTALARRAREATGGRALLFVNGDVAAAVEAGADGAHLPEAGATIAEARALCGEEMLISRAVHSLEAAMRAAAEGADVLQLGTAFATASKPGATPIGVEGVRAACAAVDAPVVAIGGITAANAGALVAAGAAGIAVIGAILDAGDARAAASALRDAMMAPART